MTTIPKTKTDLPDTEPEFANVQELLGFIQKNIKANKSRFNKHGNYKYRSCEDILEALKPFLIGDANLIINDTLECIGRVKMVNEGPDDKGQVFNNVSEGDRVYLKAVATLTYKGQSVRSTAYAREPFKRKGMDDSQVTGATSSYARKYALNGLFLIDDTQDADATNDHKDDEEAKVEPVKTIPKPFTEDELQFMLTSLHASRDMNELTEARKKMSAAKPRMSKEQIDLCSKALKVREALLLQAPSDDIPV